MSFGVEQSQGVGGQTLGGFIADKAMKSRDDAKKEKERQQKVEKEGGQVDDKDKKGLFRKALAHNLGGGFLSGKKTFSENFNYKLPPKPENPKSSADGGQSGGGGTGKGAGLAKILTGGFGSLVADTTAIQGGLTAITQLLNSQLQSSSFTASGISGITAILADQLEAQGEMIDLMGGNRPSGGSAAPSGMFGVSDSTKAGGKTLTEAMINAAIEKGIGRFLLSRLSKFNPFQKKPDVPRGPSGPKGYYDDAVETSKRNAQRFSPQEKPKGFGQQLQDIGSGLKGKANQAVDFGKGLFGKAKGVGDNIVSGITGSPIAKRLGMAGARFGGRMIPVAGTGFSAVEAADRAKKGDMVGAWLAGLGGGAGATATATSAAALTGAGAAVPAAAEVTSMAADIGLLGWDLVQAFNPASKMSSGGVMLGEAGKEAVVDLNSADAKTINASPEDPGMKASGASMLAVVDQFVKGMGPLGTPVAQALGPDVQNLARQFGMSQALPNLKIGGGKFKEDASAKKERSKFLENLISGSLEALGAKKKDSDKTINAGQPAPTGDASSSRSNERQEDTKETLENIPGAGTAMERVTPEGVRAAEGEKALMTEKEVKGTQVQLASGDKITVPSADLNPVVGSNKKYWYDNKGQIYRWKPGEKVTQLYLDEVQKQGKADSFDLVRDLRSGVVRQVSTKSDWNPFNNAGVLKPGEYSYRANDKLIDNRDKTPVWSRQNEKQDLGGIHGPDIAIPKQSNLTSFEDGGWFQRLTKWLTTPMGQGASDKTVPALQRAASSGSLGSVPQGLSNRRAATDAAIKDLLGHEKGGSMFGVSNINNTITVEQRLDDVEKMVKMLSGILMPPVNEGQKKSTQTTASPPRTAPSAPPIAATNQIADEMSGAAIINVIGGGGSAPSIPSSSGSAQNTAEYANDPSCNGLASVLCISSPWGAM